MNEVFCLHYRELIPKEEWERWFFKLDSPGEIIKDVLNVSYDATHWNNLGYKPSFCLVGKDRADQSAPRRTIFIREENADSEFTFNNIEIFANENCLLRLVFSNHDDRENAFTDLKNLLKNNTTYSLIFEGVKRENVLSLFILVIRIKLMR